MTKILEHASRVLAIMGVALLLWAGMDAQTAKAQGNPLQTCQLIPTTVNGQTGWYTCQFGTGCPPGLSCVTNNTPRYSPTIDWFVCCTLGGN